MSRSSKLAHLGDCIVLAAGKGAHEDEMYVRGAEDRGEGSLPIRRDHRIGRQLGY